MKAAVLIGVCMLAACPAFAGDGSGARPRLVTGSISPGQTALPAEASRAEMFTSGGFSVGAVSSPSAKTEAPLLGGYAAYSFDTLQLSSSLKGDRAATAADFTASYTGSLMGVDGVTALTLGVERTRPLAFSPNPIQAGMMGGETWRPITDLSLSLSFTHEVSSSMSLGGFAAATRSEEDDNAHSGLRLGAGFGVKF